MVLRIFREGRGSSHKLESVLNTYRSNTGVLCLGKWKKLKTILRDNPMGLKKTSENNFKT